MGLSGRLRGCGKLQPRDWQCLNRDQPTECSIHQIDANRKLAAKIADIGLVSLRVSYMALSSRSDKATMPRKTRCRSALTHAAVAARRRSARHSPWVATRRLAGRREDATCWLVRTAAFATGDAPDGAPAFHDQVRHSMTTGRPSPLVSTSWLAARLGVSLNAARHHLKELEAAGLVRYERENRGVGAPVFLYRLSSRPLC